MLGSLDNHLVRADAVHAVIQADPFPPQVALHLECGELVGHHTDGPARRIRLAALWTVGQDFFGGQPFLTGAKRTESGGDLSSRRAMTALKEVSWTTGPVG